MKIHRNHTWEKEGYKSSYDIVVYRSFGFAVYYIIQRIAVCRRTKNAKKISSQDEIYEWKESMACVIGLVKPKYFCHFDLSPEQRQDSVTA